MNLTASILDTMTQDPNATGFGYLGERTANLDSQPETVTKVDQYVIDRATALGWDEARLFHWVNSRPGRLFAEAVFGDVEFIEDAAFWNGLTR